MSLDNDTVAEPAPSDASSAEPGKTPHGAAGWRWLVLGKPRRPLVARLCYAAVLAITVAIFATAWRLRPDPRGLGTHEQLGLPPCGFYLSTGLPCPTCGVTTAFVWFAHGHPLKALAVQPVGAAAGAALTAVAVLAVAGLLTGRVVKANLTRRAKISLLIGAFVFFVLSWLYKLAFAMLAR